MVSLLSCHMAKLRQVANVSQPRYGAMKYNVFLLTVKKLTVQAVAAASSANMCNKAWKKSLDKLHNYLIYVKKGDIVNLLGRPWFDLKSRVDFLSSRFNFFLDNFVNRIT